MRKLPTPTLRIVALVLSLSTLLATSPIRAHSLTESSAPHAAIVNVEFNQALGASSDRYVAGKDGAILVYMDAPVAVDTANQNVTLQVGGQNLATLQPNPSDQPVNPLVFNCPQRSQCNDWKAGDYIFTANVNGNSLTKTVTLATRRPLRILALPIKASYGGNVVQTTGAWKQGGSFMKQVYPVDPANFTWVLGDELDLSDPKYDVDNDTGRAAVWEALVGRQPAECAANPKGPTCYDLIAGFVKDRMKGKDGERSLQGYTYGKPANVIVESDEDMLATVAHEVAHTFGIGDEYRGGSFHCSTNPPPPDFVGSDWDNPSNSNFSCTNSTTQAFPEGGNVLVPATIVHPFDVSGRGVLPDMAAFMGSGTKQSNYWISPDQWKVLYDGMTVVPSTLRAASGSIRLVSASGLIGQNGSVELDPWETFTDSVDIVTGEPYRIVALDALSHTLASQSFNLNFHLPDQPVLDKVGFEVAVPYPEGTTAFQILSGTLPLKTIAVYPHAPVVSVTAPSAGQTLSGTATIHWTASHPDGAPMTYMVEYNHSDNPDEWIVLATGLTDTQYTEDFSQLGGGPNARIQVTASDGVNSTQATSSLFNVPFKAPEVFIDDPLPEQRIVVDQEINLNGSAYDEQDEWLTSDSSLMWMDDRQGMLGSGELINVDNLELGRHIITLTATNSHGLSTSKSITIRVVRPNQKYLPLSLGHR